jgi:uncharacterized protein YuzE
MDFAIEGCTYDIEADAIYIPFKDVSNGEVVGNHMVEDPRLGGYVVLDIDASNRVVGIEILGVSEILQTTIPALVAP